MTNVFRRVEHLAPTDLPLLILGETGTGKEMVARAVHEITGARRPFVAVNCAALSESLAESELFGHVRGAFTGAVRESAGLLAQADGGILLLDEIAELTLAMQARFLRAIESGAFRPVGAGKSRRSSFRLIAATNQDLDGLVSENRFRRDLMYRIGGARITLPALRDRRPDIDRLASHFAAEAGSDVSAEACALLREGVWEGNVRQLRNAVRLASVLATHGRIEPRHIRQALRGAMGRRNGTERSFKTASKEARARLAREVIRRCGGSREAAAQRLGVSVSTLYRIVPARSFRGA